MNQKMNKKPTDDMLLDGMWNAMLIQMVHSSVEYYIGGGCSSKPPFAGVNKHRQIPINKEQQYWGTYISRRTHTDKLHKFRHAGLIIKHEFNFTFYFKICAALDDMICDFIRECWELVGVTQQRCPIPENIKQLETELSELIIERFPRSILEQYKQQGA